MPWLAAAIVATAALVIAQAPIGAGMVLTCGGLNTVRSPREGSPQDRYCSVFETTFDTLQSIVHPGGLIGVVAIGTRLPGTVLVIGALTRSTRLMIVDVRGGAALIVLQLAPFAALPAA